MALLSAQTSPTLNLRTSKLDTSMQSLSPVDPGYSSSSSTPWMDSDERFPYSASSSGSGTSSGHTSPDRDRTDSRVGSVNNGIGLGVAAKSKPASVSFGANRITSLGKKAPSGIAAFQPPFLTLSAAASRSNGNPSAPVPIAIMHDPASAEDGRKSFWDSSAYWLTLYFFFNLSLTLYNKVALVSFPFPWTLTCIHSASASVGSYAAWKRGYFQRSGTLNTREQLILVAFSSLYTINIAVSNVSLNKVSVPVHQVVRSTTPLFTMLISIILWRKSYLLQTYLSLIPVIFGVCLATYGDYSFSTGGLFLTLLGAVLAAIKGLATNRILVGRLKFHPLDLLLRMSPMAFAQCLVFSYLSGELSQVRDRTFITGTLGQSEWISLLMNGALAFGLNVVSFTANKKTGALTMSVAANVKQVLTMVLAVIIFNLVINGINLVGIALTISGGAYYSYVEYQSKRDRSAGIAMPVSPVPPSTPYTSQCSYSDKHSPLPNNLPNPFLDAQQQLASARAKDEKEVDAMYHRKTSSLAAFRDFKYPFKGTDSSR